MREREGGGIKKSMDCAREDMNVANLTEQHALERAQWKEGTRTSDPSRVGEKPVEVDRLAQVRRSHLSKNFCKVFKTGNVRLLYLP